MDRIKQPNSRMCFVCGLQNPIGLHLHLYEIEPGLIETTYTAPAHFQGYPGVLHGGIVAALLDEVSGRVHMAGVIYNSGYWNAKGNGKFFGSIVTKQGIAESGGGPAGTPHIWFDTCLKDKGWPPPSLKPPRVVATSWQSDM